MYFRQILHDEKACASYLVGCRTKGVCAVIDSQGDPARYGDIQRTHGMVVGAVIETHVHADRISSARPHRGGRSRYSGPVLIEGIRRFETENFMRSNDGGLPTLVKRPSVTRVREGGAVGSSTPAHARGRGSALAATGQAEPRRLLRKPAAKAAR